MGNEKLRARLLSRANVAKLFVLLVSVLSGLLLFQNCSGGKSFQSATLASSSDSGSGSASQTSNSESSTAPNDNPLITENPKSATLVLGTAVSFTVVTSGANPKFYQWKKDGVALLGANSDTLSITNISAGHAGAYTVEISNASGNVSSNPAVLTVLIPPSITQQPLSISATQNGGASFSVGVRGTSPFTYQWKKDGVNIAGATSSALNLANVQTSDAGKYSVTVNNVVTGVTSSDAVLTVNIPVTITTQPTAQNVNAGGNVSFSVTATGTAPLTYQWKKNGSNISGATQSTLSLSNVAASAAADYTVSVTNVAGSVLSNAAKLTVNLPPTITAQPAPVSAPAGGNASFTVAATGAGPLSYQWKYNGVNISGATTSVLNLTNIQGATNGGNYTVVVSNSVGSVTSNAAFLAVTSQQVSGTAPSIFTQPQSATVNAGSSASFSVVASGTSPFTYQWKKNGNNISGANSPTYSIAATTTADSGNYTVSIGNTAGNATSNIAVLTVNAAPGTGGSSGSGMPSTNSAPVITAQPSSQSISIGSSASFSVNVTGTAPFSYQWKKDGVDISGQNGASINLSNVQSGGSFTVSISNSVGSVLSNPAVLNVVQNVIAPSITSQPASLTVNAGQNASFTVAASGTSPFNYQWKKDGVNVDGATTDTLNLTNAMDTQAGNYTVSVSNSAGSITSQVAQLIVQTPASIVTQPVPAAGNQGGSASFSVVARGSPVIAYQWKKDGVNLPNQVNPTLNLNNLQPSDMGNYSVTVFNLFGSVTSDSVSLSLSTSPVITAQPMSQTVQSGSSATFSVSATGSSPLSYQWKFNGVDIQGAVSSSYTLNSAITSSAGTYSVVVSNSLGSMTSAGATLVVISAPQILSSPQSMAVNIGANVTFNVIIASDPSVVFQWQKDGVNIPGATGTALSLTNIQISDAGAYKVIANNSVGFVTSQDAILSVNQAPTITQQPVSVSVNSGGNTSLSVTATSNQPLSYQWQKDGALISGATMATLSLTNVQLSQAGSYKVSVSNSLGTVVSSAATLTVTATKLAAGNAQFTAIDAGLEMFCGISPEQYVYCWGSNATGLGDGSTTSSADAVSVPIYNATKITVGGEHACALTSTGKVYCWGNNNYGQLGVPNVTSSSVPVSVSIPGNVIAVSAGSGHTCAVTMNSDVYCWGNNNFGQLGQGVSGGYSSSPVKITTDMNFPTDVAAGGDHTCVAGPNSVSTYCFGYGGFCELGNAAAPNSTYCSSVATPTPYRLNFTLAAGGHISLGQMTSSAVVSNYWYQWGIYGADSKSNVVIGAQPTYRASGVTEVVEALASKSGTFINSAPMLLPYRCILYTNQTISCQDTNLSTTYLYSVGGVPNPVHLAVGGTKACALRSDNLVNCWSLPTSGVSGNLQRK